MFNMKEMLAKHLLEIYNEEYDMLLFDFTEDRANYGAEKLIEKGVMLPPCNLNDEIDDQIVEDINYHKWLCFSGEEKSDCKINLRNKDETGPIYTSRVLTFDEAYDKINKKD